MNPPGMFADNKRQREYSTANDPLPLSGKLIPEFFGRRNIRDMFTRKPFLSQLPSIGSLIEEVKDPVLKTSNKNIIPQESSNPVLNSTSLLPSMISFIPAQSPSAVGKKRSAVEVHANKSSKRTKSSPGVFTPPVAGKGQRNLKGFFGPKDVVAVELRRSEEARKNDATIDSVLVSAPGTHERQHSSGSYDVADNLAKSIESLPRDAATAARTSLHHSNGECPLAARSDVNVHDPIESKESWSKLFMKPAAPRCEGHDEPCITLLTKKPGINLGRSFWMCPRPLGPTGGKEKNTQWRCQTFIWCSDWNPTRGNNG